MTTKYSSLNSLASNPELENAVKLDTLFGDTLDVKGFNLIQVGANECAIIDSDKGKVSTFSKVIIDQLRLMIDGFNQGLHFKVRAVKEKNYYKFEEVE